MSNVVYMTTNVKPGEEIVLAMGYHQLVAVVPKEEVLAQGYQEGGPRAGDMARCAAFKLSDAGIGIFRSGIVGPPRGFKEWPEGVPEPDWKRYPIRSELALR